MNDKALGGTIFIGGLGGIACYFWLIFFSPWTMLTLQLSAFIAVAMVLVIVAWIGYTMATVPPPAPLEDLNLPGNVQEEETQSEPV